MILTMACTTSKYCAAKFVFTHALDTVWAIYDWFTVLGHFLSTGRALKNHVFSSRIVRSEIECSLTCLRYERCESFNYRDNIVEGPHICELNDQTRLKRSHDVQPRNGFSYYDSELVSFPVRFKLIKCDSKNFVKRVRKDQQNQHFHGYFHIKCNISNSLISFPTIAKNTYFPKQLHLLIWKILKYKFLFS